MIDFVDKTEACSLSTDRNTYESFGRRLMTRVRGQAGCGRS